MESGWRSTVSSNRLSLLHTLDQLTKARHVLQIRTKGTIVTTSHYNSQIVLRVAV